MNCTGNFETYTNCGSGCGDRNCEDDPNQMCPAVCREGCFCMGGYARNQLGECIPFDECPGLRRRSSKKIKNFLIVYCF